MSQILIKCIYKQKIHVKQKILINKRESTGINCLNDSKAFIENSIDMDDIYKNIEEYNPNKERKILIAFDDMIADSLVINILIQ